nr:hypothetical protein [Microcystis aeruginosa]
MVVAASTVDGFTATATVDGVEDVEAKAIVGFFSGGVAGDYYQVIGAGGSIGGGATEGTGSAIKGDATGEDCYYC